MNFHEIIPIADLQQIHWRWNLEYKNLAWYNIQKLKFHSSITCEIRELPIFLIRTRFNGQVEVVLLNHSTYAKEIFNIMHKSPNLQTWPYHTEDGLRPKRKIIRHFIYLFILILTLRKPSKEKLALTTEPHTNLTATKDILFLYLHVKIFHQSRYLLSNLSTWNTNAHSFRYPDTQLNNEQTN